MKPQASRRYPEESFYFEYQEMRSELVVDQHVLPECYPRVRALQGRQVICIYEDNEGRELGNSYEFCRQEPFLTGFRLLRIETGNARPKLSWTRDGHKNMRFAVDPLDSYEVGAGDTLITELTWLDDETDIYFANATAPLPHQGANLDINRYRPLGVIRPNNELVTWREAQDNVAWLSNIALANSLVTNAYELAIVQKEVLGLSVLGQLQSSRITRAYFDTLRSRSSIEYAPKQEPASRTHEFTEELTPTQRKRIWALD